VLEEVGQPRQQLALLTWTRLGGDPVTVDDQEVANDLAALLTLATRRRFRAVNEVPTQLQGTTFTAFLPAAQAVDSELAAPVPVGALDGVDDLMWSVLSIAEDDAFSAIAQAVRLYHTAVLTMGVDPTAAYTLLVATLETLAGAFEPAPAVWNELGAHAEWDQLFTEAELNQEQADALRQRLLAQKHLNLGRRFVSYGVRMTPGTFWTDEWRVWAPVIQLTQQGANLTGDGNFDVRHPDERIRHAAPQLPQLLRNVYDARSGYIHAGQALAHAQLHGLAGADLTASGAVGPGRREDLPSLEYFERLVRAILMRAIAELPKDPAFEPIDLQIGM
jgi:hypothetical protein